MVSSIESESLIPNGKNKTDFGSTTASPQPTTTMTYQSDSSNLCESLQKMNDIDKTPDEFPRKIKHPLVIAAILSTAFAYGCILTTLFMITIPVECERIQKENPEMQKSVTLGIFVAIAGVTQLVTPLVGMLSDSYVPPVLDVGQRLPYLVLGTILTVAGLMGQTVASYFGAMWIRYGFAFFLHMFGLNMIYSMMIALIPDQIHESQTGAANGILAFLLVSGSLFAFVLFHTVMGESIIDMYGLYICIVIFTTILTCLWAHDDDVEHTKLLREKSGSDDDSIIDLSSSSLADIPGDKAGTKKRRRQRRRLIILTPFILLKTMILDPFATMEWETFRNSYTMDTVRYHDFYIVTVSRTLYYMGISSQTFFLYYMHDVIGVHENTASAVAFLSILGQFGGAVTCYPIGLISDIFCGGRRKPFVYLACLILAGTHISMIFLTNMTQAMIVGSILGSANGMYLVMDTSLAVDTLPSDIEEGSSGNAQLLGIWGIAGFVGYSLGPLIGGPMLYLFGHQDVSDEGVASDTIEYSLRGYAVLVSLSALYFFLSAITLRYIKKTGV